MLDSIRLVIGIDLGQKGLPPKIIAPILNMLQLMDQEMKELGTDFCNPEIYKEHQRLKEAIIKSGFGEIIPDEQEVEEVEPEVEGVFNAMQITDEDEEDPLAFLDNF